MNVSPKKYAESLQTAPKSINLDIASTVIRFYNDLNERTNNPINIIENLNAQVIYVDKIPLATQLLTENFHPETDSWALLRISLKILIRLFSQYPNKLPW